MVKTVKKWLDDSIGGYVRKSKCSICNEKFETQQTIFNFFFFSEKHLLKEHHHSKEFHSKGLNKKELAKIYAKLIFLTGFNWIFFIVCVPLVAVIHFITFPFWWIHEKTYL